VNFLRGNRPSYRLAAAVTILLLTQGTIPAQAEQVFPKPSSPWHISLDACTRVTELDCIDSVSSLSADGQTELPGSHLGFELLREGRDDKKNFERAGSSLWRVTSASGAQVDYEIDARLESPRSRVHSIDWNPAGALRMNVYGQWDDFETHLVIKVRTSWLKPINIPIYAVDALVDSKQIKGGTLWTFSGKRSKIFHWEDWSKYEENVKKGIAADSQSSYFRFIVDHAGKSASESFYDPRCARHGYTAQTSNAAGGGAPYWNNETKSLDFGISSPTMDPDGNRVRGYFRLWVNLDFVKCQWPESSLWNANYFQVGVFNENGTKQTATTVVSAKRGQLYVAAYNFHYSSPTIKLQAAKRATLTCVSGSDSSKTRSVRGKKPKCPAGFKPLS
jgi:hypothetical protein